MNKKQKRVSFVTPTKTKLSSSTSSTPNKKVLPVYFSSLKTRGLQKLLDYVKKVETESGRLRARERKLTDRLEKCKDKNRRDRQVFDEAITKMATRLFTQENLHKKVRRKKSINKISMIHFYQIVEEKNDVLVDISRKLLDLQTNLEMEKSRIEQDMLEKNKTIRRLRQQNHKLKQHNKVVEEGENMFVPGDTLDKDDSGRESDINDNSDHNLGDAEDALSDKFKAEVNETKKIVCYLTCFL